MGRSNLTLVLEGVSNFILKKHVTNRTRETAYALLHKSIKFDYQPNI